MGKTIKSIAQLEAIKSEFLKNSEKFKYQILVCGGTGCVSSNCAAIENAVNEALQEQGMAKDVKVYQTGCMGICAL
jgi:NADH-quinone oxidoreductase subunit F